MLMGAHAAPVVRAPPPIRLHYHCSHPYCYLLFLFVVLLLSSSPSGAAASALLEEEEEGKQVQKVLQHEKERDALLKFKSSLGRNVNSVLSDWNVVNIDTSSLSSSFPCPSLESSLPWTGVLCYNGNVWGLQLEHLNLSGEINVDFLLPLSQLRTLSFMNNKFEGPLPEFRKLGALKSLYLSFNRFSGDIPDDAFKGMFSLKKIYMSNNMFTGTIPTSLAYSPKLFELRLEHNQFTGSIPDFPPGVLKHLNVSYNQLHGPIPPSLKHLDFSSFSGNKDLCGPPLRPVCSNGTSSPTPESATNTPSSSTTPPPPASLSTKTISLATIIVYVVCGLILLVLIAMLFMVLHRSKNRKIGPTRTPAAASPYYKDDKWSAGDVSVQPPNSDGNHQLLHHGAAVAELTRGHSRNKSNSSSTSTSTGSSSTSPPGDQHGKLSFIRDDRLRFDLQDLLRASAEVLGSGSFGSSYKAVLMDGQAVVVKRFKQMNNCGKEEFHEHMRRLGRLSHPNLLPLVAYYYRKEEKLLVFDFVHNGSLARHLHGNKSVVLDWPARLKIIKGVARGLAYLYNELPSLTVPHGHLKSSNVLLDKSMEPHLMDYTLVPVVKLEQAQQFMVAYKSPEYTKNGYTTKKTDVWSLGILILETLTGKLPANYLAQGPGYGEDLANWVTSIVEEEDIFDKEMGSTNNAQGQMHKLLEIGAHCCKVDVETRLDFKDAVDKIEMVKERDQH